MSDQPKVLLHIPYLVLLVRTFAVNELNYKVGNIDLFMCVTFVTMCTAKDDYMIKLGIHFIARGTLIVAQ